MNKPSYLLALDGSIESKSAAELAWSLAKRTGASVTAQHVINIRDIWHFLRPKSAGFIGSGPYIAAFQCVANGLREIAEALMLSYQSQVESQGIEFSTHIDEGDLVAEICKRAKDHDLLIIGRGILESKDRNVEHSLCNELANICPCPMLIITSQNADWTSLRARVLSSNVDVHLVDSLGNFAKSLQVPLVVELEPNIAPKEASIFMDQLAALDHKQWNISQSENIEIAHSDGELIVVVPGTESRSTTTSKSSCLDLKNWTQSALLIWRNQRNPSANSVT